MERNGTVETGRKTERNGNFFLTHTVGVILEPAARKYRDYVFDKGDSSGYC